ncbi:hypothetical protein B6U81_05335 [Thermoplasmatales archaeon ex4484_30]|nr:MAG: hypothetical protein B6U81_05335 [Thermoplasmatales archaeon ex4484_30]
MEEIIVDVRMREEFVKEHIKGAINIPLYDIDFYVDFLRNKKINFCCDTGRRAKMAKEMLASKGIESHAMMPEEMAKYEKEGKDIICAVNYVVVRKGMEENFEKSVEELCKATDEMPGFLGGKLLRVSGISAIGSSLPGDLKDEEIKPKKYIMLTYWESKEVSKIIAELKKKGEVIVPKRCYYAPAERK